MAGGDGDADRAFAFAQAFSDLAQLFGSGGSALPRAAMRASASRRRRAKSDMPVASAAGGAVGRA